MHALNNQSLRYVTMFILTGPGLALKGVTIPNNSVLKRDPSVIGTDDEALYCVTDDVTCCGIPPSPGDGGSGNGRGRWHTPSRNLTSSTFNRNLWYASWLTGAVLMNFRGSAINGSRGLRRCDIQDHKGKLHQFYICIYTIDTEICKLVSIRIT